MNETPRKSSRVKDIVAQWDGKDFFGRLQLVMDNSDLFWDLRLITRSEIEAVVSMPESSLEYIVDREDHPIFTSLDLKSTLATQLHRNKLEAALNAVFLKPSAKDHRMAT